MKRDWDAIESRFFDLPFLVVLGTVFSLVALAVAAVAVLIFAITWAFLINGWLGLAVVAGLVYFGPVRALVYAWRKVAS